MGEVFAGFLAGFILALVSTPLLAFTLVRLRTRSVVLARLLPPDVPAIGLIVLVHGALFMFWTAVGILLGLVLLAIRNAGGALGSRNAAFSLFVAALVLMVAAPLVIAVRPLRQPALVCAVVAVVVFGWLMPYMAGWSKFDREERQQGLEFVPFTASAGGEREDGVVGLRRGVVARGKILLRRNDKPSPPSPLAPLPGRERGSWCQRATSRL